jgi:hypothetical protein
VLKLLTIVENVTLDEMWSKQPYLRCIVLDRIYTLTNVEKA